MRRWITVVVAALVLAGCGTGGGDGGASAFPLDTAQDLVTYGDYLVEVTAASETTTPPDEDEVRAGEGLFRREFTMPIVKTQWARPGSRPALTIDTLELTSGGWQFRDGDLNQRKKIDEPNQLVVGRHYLALLTHEANDTLNGGWWCIGLLPIVDGTIGKVKTGGESGERPIIGQLHGKTPEQVVALLRATEPDPRVVPYLDRDAAERYQAAYADTGEATPGPGESS